MSDTDPFIEEVYRGVKTERVVSRCCAAEVTIQGCDRAHWARNAAIGVALIGGSLLLSKSVDQTAFHPMVTQ